MQHPRVDEIPVAYPGSGAFRRLRRSPFAGRYDPAGLKRRGFLSVVTAVGTAAGLAAMNVFPNVREARATHDTWTGFSDCGSLQYDPPCNDPCTGFTDDVRGPENCTQCDEIGEPHGVWAWHYDGYRPHDVPHNQAVWEFRDLAGDICPGPGGPRDAWNWDFASCPMYPPSGSVTCAPMKIRCHDGHKRSVPGTTWRITICEGFRECGTQTGRFVMCGF